MWINTSISLPLREGFYICLIDFDGFGNMVESKKEKFNGKDWDLYESNCQFISYWWATKEEYEIISYKLENK